MTEIYDYIDIFNNREKAVIIWLFIFIIMFLIGMLLRKDIRASTFGVLKILFKKKIIIVFVAMFSYVSLIILLFSVIQIWNISLVKDTIYWVIGSAILLLMNTNEATQDEHHFRKILLDNLKLILILEFVINLTSFNLLAELILIPLLVVLSVMSAVAETKKEWLPAKKLVDFILSFIVFSLIIYAVYNIVSDYQSFVTMDNLRSFILPPLLTVAYIPFLYLFALVMAYEILFIRLDFILKNNKALASFAKQRIFRLCFLSLGKLNSFAKDSTSDIYKLKDKNDILNLVEKFNKHGSVRF